MEEVMKGWPAWVAFVVLFLGALVRGAATYAVGRIVRTRGQTSRWAERLDRPVVARAEGWIRRFGAPLVSVGFLTVGVQSAINASAGLLRMPLRRFGPALVVGALLWATLYFTVGLAVVDAFLGRISWWWALAGLAVLLAAVLLSRRLGRNTPAS